MVGGEFVPLYSLVLGSRQSPTLPRHDPGIDDESRNIL